MKENTLQLAMNDMGVDGRVWARMGVRASVSACVRSKNCFQIKEGIKITWYNRYNV